MTEHEELLGAGLASEVCLFSPTAPVSFTACLASVFALMWPLASSRAVPPPPRTQEPLFLGQLCCREGAARAQLALVWPGPDLESLQAGGPRALQALLEDRIRNYREAAASAKEAGDAAKTRRCERGLKVGCAQPGAGLGGGPRAARGWASSGGRPPRWPGGGGGSDWVSGSLPQTLGSQLAAVRRGRKINEEEIPPPVAVGKKAPAPQETASRSPEADLPVPPSTPPGTSVLLCFPRSGPLARSPSALRWPESPFLWCWQPWCTFFDPDILSLDHLFLPRQPFSA